MGPEIVLTDDIRFFFHSGMAPSSEFNMDKMNPAQKVNNKVEGTPKPDSKKVQVQKIKFVFV